MSIPIPAETKTAALQAWMHLYRERRVCVCRVEIFLHQPDDQILLVAWFALDQPQLGVSLGVWEFGETAVVAVVLVVVRLILPALVPLADLSGERGGNVGRRRGEWGARGAGAGVALGVCGGVALGYAAGWHWVYAVGWRWVVWWVGTRLW
jgi:MFS family permease